MPYDHLKQNPTNKCFRSNIGGVRMIHLQKQSAPRERSRSDGLKPSSNREQNRPHQKALKQGFVNLLMLERSTHKAWPRRRARNHPISGAQPTVLCHVGAHSLQVLVRCWPCCSCFRRMLHPTNVRQCWSTPWRKCWHATHTLEQRQLLNSLSST